MRQSCQDACTVTVYERVCVETVFILWSLCALVLDIITPRVCDWPLNISVLLSRVEMAPLYKKKALCDIVQNPAGKYL